MFTKFLLLLLLVGSTANAAYFPTFSINNFNALGIYNLTPPVLTDGQTANLQLDSSGNLLVTINGSSGPISFTSTQLPPALGAQVTASSMAVNIASDQVVPISSASLTSIDGKLNDDYGVSSGALRTAAQVGNATGAADFGAGVTSAQTMRVVLPTDQSPIPTSSVISVNGSGSAAAATVSTVITLTAPANATGFVLMNLDTSTANLRWSIGRVAAIDLGQQLQPGRDSGFVPCGANVSLIAESGTQNYDIQWVSQ